MTTFATALKSLRAARRYSQMRLALAADVSTRHISFLETGKAAPSRAMVLRLCRALGASPETVNSFLASAGYTEEYPSRPLDAAELAPFVEAASRLLNNHDPNPGWLVDPQWRIDRTNRAGRSIMALLGIEAGSGLVEAVIKDPTLGGVVVNWRESAVYLQRRLTAEARRRGCARTAGLAERLGQLAGDFDEPASNSPASPTVLSVGGRTVRLISVLCQFNTALDLTLIGLRAELFFPLDAESEAVLLELCEAE